MVKHAPPPEAADPQLDVEALLARLEEAESTLSAIRDGHVEALVVSSQKARRYTPWRAPNIAIDAWSRP